VQTVHDPERGAEEPDGAGDGLRGVQVDQHQGGRAGEDTRHLSQGHAGRHLCPSQQVPINYRKVTAFLALRPQCANLLRWYQNLPLILD
jgi:hypothetical protein